MRDSETAVIILSALANETRFNVFQLLAKKRSGLKQGDLAKILDVPVQTLSFHLKQMRHAGIVNQERDGTVLYYSLNKMMIKKLAGYFNLQSHALTAKKIKY